jgi:antitoxin component YwqK of YwqJK toxin-antitoxin module
MERVNITDIDFNNDYSYTYRGVPFTGIAYESGANGRVVAEMTFMDGVQEGERREWYPSGVLRLESNYLHNGLHGVTKEWFPSGTLKRRAKHELGVLVESDIWNEDASAASSYRLAETDPNYRTLERLRLAKWRVKGKADV